MTLVLRAPRVGEEWRPVQAPFLVVGAGVADVAVLGGGVAAVALAHWGRQSPARVVPTALPAS